MQARPHPLQAERLQALYSYEVLDTDREKDFDDIVELASAICGTAISVVNLIDVDRQWFKAETGLGVRETPLATSICSHAILESRFVEIHDTLADPRMQDNPLCTGEPGLRFYAGAQLLTQDGLPLGTLCVLDYEPKSLTPLQRDTLRVLARQVMAQLEMRKALRATTLLRQEVDHRVKNSLQSLSAYVRLQARGAKSDDTRDALAATGNRISAVATLHEQLYLADAGPTVALDRYVASLCDHLLTGAPENVTLDVAVVPVTVGSRQAVAVGTLINEFVTNSYKHAFPDGKGGSVSIAITRGADGLVHVTCRDDGVGLGENADTRSGGLGMQIARVICAELQCDLVFEPGEQGVVLKIAFAAEEFHGA
ncbi:sensor histidine kinase [Pelagibacterium luteolum]|uniref:Two-component sensor histidine kinase, contains HisKA and HATPase domains n=1 Tax=Pelagibacterium luteolum TaxID=440168 RepID=A0A1G7ZED6_9HYPH|nr:histidine kinase dimerization/phosphoacceptor domain -containing protein [Pelagibacterium luteolum]SDH06927.1 Two-component sensor histidine kinase, contains HisKA and HATPase domains [Pelagibacterium luteolum]